MTVPEFQAYLKQRLESEHRDLRLRRSRRTWRTAALGAMALVVAGLVNPDLALRANGLLAARGSADPVLVEVREEPAVPPELEGTLPLARALATSLAQDRALLGKMEGRDRPRSDHSPRRARVLSRYPLERGGELAIYTTVTLDGQAVRDDVRTRMIGGV